MLSFNHLINILMNVVKKISIWTVLIFSFVPVLVQSCLGSYGFTVPVLVPWLWFILLDTRILVQGFQGIICIFLILVLVWFDFDTISVLDQVEPQVLVLEPNLTGTETAQNKQQ